METHQSFWRRIPALLQEQFLEWSDPPLWPNGILEIPLQARQGIVRDVS